MKKITAKLIKNLISKLLESMRRFPEAIIMAGIAVAAAVVLNHITVVTANNIHSLVKRIGMAATLGIPIFLCTKVLIERHPKLNLLKKSLLQISALLFLVFYFFFLLRDINFLSTTRYAAFSISFYLLFIVIPQFKNRDSFELYVIKLLTRLIVTYVYSMILYGGLAAILFTIDKLFSIHLSGKLYFDIWIIVAGFFSPIYFFADLPKSEERFDNANYPKVLKVLILYILMPILSIYTAILYAYFIKIIATKNWPVGLISNLVLWYSLIGITVLFFIYPTRTENNWSKKFIFIFPKLILPLMLMMFTSMGIRIRAYGITESRYYVLIAGAWVIGCMIYLGIKRNARNLFLPLSLSIVVLLTSIGPWSAYSISRLSQNNRFEKIVSKYGMLKDRTLVKPSSEFSSEDKKEVSSILQYFSNRHSLKEIGSLPKDFTLNKTKDLFGFETDYLTPMEKNNYFNHMLQENNELFDAAGYDYFLDISAVKSQNVKSSKGSVLVTYSMQDRQLIISDNDKEIYSSNVDDIAINIHKNNIGNESLSTDKATFSDKNERVTVTYVFEQISGFGNEQNNDFHIEAMDFNVFIKLHQEP